MTPHPNYDFFRAEELFSLTLPLLALSGRRKGWISWMLMYRLPALLKLF